MKSNASQHSIFELTRQEKGVKAINQERKIDSSSSDVIKTFTLDKPITDSTVVLKTGNRQTDRQNTYLPFDRPYPFSLGDRILKFGQATNRIFTQLIEHCRNLGNPKRFRWSGFIGSRALKISISREIRSDSDLWITRVPTTVSCRILQQKDTRFRQI